MKYDATSIKETKKIKKENIEFSVGIKRSAKTPFDFLIYHLQRAISPDQRRLYRFYNLAQKRFWEAVEKNAWEPQTFDIFRHFLKPTHSYIDIGAWIGPTVLYGCQIAKHCYAIEPDPIAYRLLQDNLSLNKKTCSNVTLINKCIGPKNEKVRLGSSSKTGGDSRSSLLNGHTKIGWEVDSITLESLYEQYKIDDCNFIKMDIEGAELFIIPAISAFLQRNKPSLFLSLHPMMFPDAENDLKKIISSLDHYSYILDITGKPLKRDLSIIINQEAIIATDCY